MIRYAVKVKPVLRAEVKQNESVSQMEDMIVVCIVERVTGFTGERDCAWRFEGVEKVPTVERRGE